MAGFVINASLNSGKYLIQAIALVIKSLSLQIHVLLNGVYQLNIINYAFISVWIVWVICMDLHYGHNYVVKIVVILNWYVCFEMLLIKCNGITA